MPLAEIRKVGLASGWKHAASANLSTYLGRAKGLAILTPEGWKLTGSGRAHVSAFRKVPEKKALQAADALRKHIGNLKDDHTKAFVEEAVRCFEEGLYRSAVVLSWVGALSAIYDHVIAKKLSEFNAEAVRRNAKWKTAKSKDDLSLMSEHDFLQILPAISVVGKNVKDELEGCLKLRNGCGHPNSLKVKEARVAAHIETLIVNVFEIGQ